MNNPDFLFPKFVTQSDILSKYKLDNWRLHQQFLSLLGIPCHVILLKINKRGIIRKKCIVRK